MGRQHLYHWMLQKIILISIFVTPNCKFQHNNKPKFSTDKERMENESNPKLFDLDKEKHETECNPLKI